MRVGDRLLAASADLCKSPSHLQTGALLHRPADYGPRLRPAFTAAPDTQLVAVVIPGSPAEAAGLREGDEVREVRPPGPRETAWTWTLVRAGQSFELQLRPNRVCAASPRVVTSRAFKASATAVDADIQISSELVQFARTDDELAVVLGHEIAHLLPPRDRERRASSREREQRADELGLYLAARGGYDVSVAPAFFTRLTKAYGPLLIFDSKHPPPKARAAHLAQVVAAIRERQARGAPLSPPEAG